MKNYLILKLMDYNPVDQDVKYVFDIIEDNSVSENIKNIIDDCLKWVLEMEGSSWVDTYVKQSFISCLDKFDSYVRKRKIIKVTIDGPLKVYFGLDPTSFTYIYNLSEVEIEGVPSINEYSRRKGTRLSMGSRR